MRADGERQRVSFRFLVNHPRCRPSSRTAAEGANRGRQLASWSDVKPEKRPLMEQRFAHLMEINCGFRSGDPFRPEPGEPRPESDPDHTTLTERREAKAAELSVLRPEEAKLLLGVAHVGARTLERWEKRRRKYGIVGCADHRWLRSSGGHPSISEEVREAIFAVRQETQQHRSRVSARTREIMIRRYVRETFEIANEAEGQEENEKGSKGREIKVPSYHTLLRVWKEWFGPGGARPKYERSAELPTKNGHVLVTRPGQVVALDTTILPVMVRENVFGDPVTVHFTLALDVYTHSICAFRLTLVSDSSVDVAMMLRDVMLPLPMREEWGEDMEWPYPGCRPPWSPSSPVTRWPPCRSSTPRPSPPTTLRLPQPPSCGRPGGDGLPDPAGSRSAPPGQGRGGAHFRRYPLAGVREVARLHGSRRRRPRCRPGGSAVLTLSQMEHYIATWVVGIWQNRRLGEFAPCWDPGGDHSPNTLFAASFAQGGFDLDIPSPETYYRFLPEHHVKRIYRRGVKVKGLWYDAELLHQPDLQSARGGRYKKQWVIHREPRDRRMVFFHDPDTHEWHELRWTGLPPEARCRPSGMHGSRNSSRAYGKRG